MIDLVTGDPPIATSDGQVGVALNGEIYNYRELRSELQVRGHRFRTAGDTEVVAQLAQTLKPLEVARRLHGMFAIAWWDDRTGDLVLVRDRLGKKPLYYWDDGRCFVFGSEIKSLLTHPSVPSSLADGAIENYLSFGYVPTPGTFYEGVRSVPPGHVLVVKPDAAPELMPYWQPTAPRRGEHLRLSRREAAEAVRDRLEVAVAKRMVADVPIGAFLSGGVDSSAVAALMARHSPGSVRTFTIGFEDQNGFDERPYAAGVARHIGAEHTEFVVQPHAVDLVEKLVWHHDQPFGDSSAVPTFLLSELTAKHVTVALCGDGGDEVFAGYERFAAGVAATGLEHLPRGVRGGAARSLVDTVPGNRLAKVSRFLEAVDRGMPSAYRQWISYTPDELLEGLIPGARPSGWEAYDRRWAASRGSRPLDRLLLLNLETYLLDDLLPKVDRMSMAHGLEVRAPFLDHELVEFGLRLPPRTKIRGFDLKVCLKEAVEGMLPPGILDRPKRGFGVPLDRWFREDLASYVEATLGSPNAAVRRHVDGAALDILLAEHRTGSRQHGHALWTILTLEVFLRDRQW